MGKIAEGENIKKFSLFVLFLVFCNLSVFSQSGIRDSAVKSMIQGYNSYQEGDWASTSLFLRKAVSDSSVANPEAWYMLVNSDMNSEDYSNAILDADYFLQVYPGHALSGRVEYQKGKALHMLGQNESSILVLSDFCHEYPDSDLYPSAIFWIAESFYENYVFDAAVELYSQVAYSYPKCDKVNEAKYKLDLIAYKEREQKLLYLLKMTGEEYLATRESYERQLKQYQTEDLMEVRKQLDAALERIRELEENGMKVSTSEPVDVVIESSGPKVENPADTEDEELRLLKMKAAQLKKVLES